MAGPNAILTEWQDENKAAVMEKLLLLWGSLFLNTQSKYFTKWVLCHSRRRLLLQNYLNSELPFVLWWWKNSVCVVFSCQLRLWSKKWQSNKRIRMTTSHHSHSLVSQEATKLRHFGWQSKNVPASSPNTRHLSGIHVRRTVSGNHGEEVQITVALEISLCLLSSV